MKSLGSTSRFAVFALSFSLTLAMAVLALYVDGPLSTYVYQEMQSQLGATDCAYKISLAGLSGPYLIGFALSALVGRILGTYTRKDTVRMVAQQITAKSLFLFSALAFAGLSNNLIKFIVGRSRPKLLAQQNLYELHPFTWASNWNSFPSGHATNSFALAVSLCILFPRQKVFFLATASLIALSRISVNAHYLSDVLCGSLWGIVAVLFWVCFIRKNEPLLTKLGLFPFIASRLDR